MNSLSEVELSPHIGTPLSQALLRSGGDTALSQEQGSAGHSTGSEDVTALVLLLFQVFIIA